MVEWTTAVPAIQGNGMSAAWARSVKESDDMGGIFRKRARCSRTSGSAAPIGSSIGTIGALSPVYTDTVLFDNDSMCSAGFININTAGIWFVTLTAEWVSNGFQGFRSVEIWEATAGRHLAPSMKTGSTTGSTYHYVHALENLGEDAVIQARVAQSSGHNAWFTGGWWGLCLSAFLVSG